MIYLNNCRIGTIKNQNLVKQFYQDTIKKKLTERQYSSGSMIGQPSMPFKSQHMSLKQPNTPTRQSQQQQSVNSLQSDFTDLIFEYRNNSYKIETQLQTFNQFIEQIKQPLITTFTESILEDNNKNNRKQDQLKDQIVMQKGILYTLEKQVKSLENLRKQIEKQNENKKNYIEQLTKQQKIEKMKLQLSSQKSIKKNLKKNSNIAQRQQCSLKINSVSSKSENNSNNRILQQIKQFEFEKEQEASKIIKIRKCCCCNIM